MKFRFHISCLALALALAGSLVTPAMADESNKETRMQTNVPLEIPGHMLEPGTYIFRLTDSTSNRQIVQVFSEDANGKQTFVTTILAISAYRQLTPDKPIFNMEERPSGSPEAIQSWFYPGDNTGWEFVYSKSDRIETAHNQAPAEQPAPAAIEPPKPPAEPVAAPQPKPKPAEEAVIAETDTAALAPEITPEIRGGADRELPQTAGYSATERLVGLTILSLGGLILLVALRRNAA